MRVTPEQAAVFAAYDRDDAGQTTWYRSDPSLLARADQQESPYDATEMDWLRDLALDHADLTAALDKVRAERDEARNVCEQLSARTEAAELGEKVLTAERDEARKHPGADDSRVAAINDAVMDFVTRKDNPRLVCFHVPVIECEVLMFAVGEGLPKAIAYAQFIRTLERSAGIESDSSAVSERDALRAEVEALKKCASCGKPLSRDCPTCKHLWET
jgi:hypothetical protein